MVDKKICFSPLHQLFEASSPARKLNLFDMDYNSPYEKSFLKDLSPFEKKSPILIRDGTLKLLWHFFNENTLEPSFLLPYSMAPFVKKERFKFFYNIQKTSDYNFFSSKSLLLIFYFNPLTYPLHMVEEALSGIKKVITKYAEKNIYCHIIYPEKNIHSLYFLKLYTHSYYALITKKIGFIPTFITEEELGQLSDMSQWEVHFLNLHWCIGDFYLEHFYASKNARLSRFSNSLQPIKEIQSSISLSPFHNLIIGEIPSQGKKEKEIKEKFKELKKIFPRNESSNDEIPSEFIAAITL